MTDSARKLIAEAREKAGKATKGPWKYLDFADIRSDLNGMIYPGNTGKAPVAEAFSTEGPKNLRAENGVFIASARTLVPALADLAEKQLAILAQIEEFAPGIGKQAEEAVERAALKALEEK